MKKIGTELNVWINSYLKPALSNHRNFMVHGNNPESEYDQRKALEDFNSTYELLLHSISEIRKVLYDTPNMENQGAKLVERTLNNFEENCKAYKLTDREIEIVKLIALGSSDKSIADLLFISPKTVQSHVGNAFKKVNVNKRISLISKLELPVQGNNNK